jgi:hypothetical protein
VPAINAMSQLLPAEPLFMSLLVSQHKVIDSLTELIMYIQFIVEKLMNPKNKNKYKESK